MAEKKKTPLEIGTEIESEHQSTYDWLVSELEKNGKLPPAEELFKRIASDHIDELGELYYDEEQGLPEMERKLKKIKETQTEAHDIDQLLNDKDVKAALFEKLGVKLKSAKTSVKFEDGDLVRETVMKVSDSEFVHEITIGRMEQALGEFLSEKQKILLRGKDLVYTKRVPDLLGLKKALTEKLKKETVKLIKDKILLRRALKENKSALIQLNTNDDDFAEIVTEIAELVEKG